MYKLENQIRNAMAVVQNNNDRTGGLEETLNEWMEDQVNLRELRDTWLDRSVMAEGEVTVLRERVDLQEKTIECLQKTIRNLMKMMKKTTSILNSLNEPAPAGK